MSNSISGERSSDHNEEAQRELYHELETMRSLGSKFLRFSVLGIWSFDTAITISVIALVISFVQLLVTTPFLLDLYLKLRLVVEQVLHSGSPTVVTFYVRNEGRATAKSIEIGVVAGEQDRLSIMSDLGNLGGTVNNDASKVIRNFRVTIPYLNRSEGFWVHVQRLCQHLIR